MIVDIPNIPDQTPLVMAVQASPTSRVSRADFIAKVCQEVEHASSEGDNGNMLSPQTFLARLLRLKDNALDPLVRLESPPAQGRLRRIAFTSREQLPESQTLWTTVYANADGSLPATPSNTDTIKYFTPAGEEYRYITTPSFYGNDRAVFSVEYMGKRYRIDLDLIVSDFVTQSDAKSPCPAPRLIKVTSRPS